MACSNLPGHGEAFISTAANTEVPVAARSTHAIGVACQGGDTKPSIDRKVASSSSLITPQKPANLRLYNLKRMMSIFGIWGLLEAIRA